jgi:hypothetical protein
MAGEPNTSEEGDHSVAESIIIHFRTAHRTSFAAILDRLASRTRTGGEAWRYPAEEGCTLTIYPCDDHLLTEYDPEEIARVRGVLGGLPSDSLDVELRRSSGDRAVDDTVALAVELLRLFDGVVDDNYSELWTRDEIEAGTAKGDGRFLDCYRFHGTAG